MLIVAADGSFGFSRKKALVFRGKVVRPFPRLPPTASTTQCRLCSSPVRRDQDSQRNASQTIASKQLTSTLYGNRTFDWAAVAEYNGGSGLYL